MTLLEVTFSDFVDIAVVGVLFWGLLAWTRRMHARMALAGLAFLGAFYLLARQFELQLTAWIFQGFFAVLVVLLVVVFQDDLRRLFEQIAALGPWQKGIEAPRRAVWRYWFARYIYWRRSGGGALVVLPGREPLDRLLQGGIVLLHATISEELIDSLFGTTSAGHDGALLMREDRLERFAVYLPLSENRGELGPGGTRHAAALGLSERSGRPLPRGVGGARHHRRREPGSTGSCRRSLTNCWPDCRSTRGRRSGRAPKYGPGAGWRVISPKGVLSFALAFGAWVFLVPGASVEESTYEVAVGVENLPDGYALEGVRPAVVDVTVKGPRRALLLASQGRLSALVIDADYVRFGRRTFEVRRQGRSGTGRIWRLSTWNPARSGWMYARSRMSGRRFLPRPRLTCPFRSRAPRGFRHGRRSGQRRVVDWTRNPPAVRRALPTTTKKPTVPLIPSCAGRQEQQEARQQHHAQAIQQGPGRPTACLPFPPADRTYSERGRRVSRAIDSETTTARTHDACREHRSRVTASTENGKVEREARGKTRRKQGVQSAPDNRQFREDVIGDHRHRPSGFPPGHQIDPDHPERPYLVVRTRLY